MIAVPAGAPLCQNCDHFRYGGNGTCLRGVYHEGVDPVNGAALLTGYKTPRVERQAGGWFSRKCGPKGRHFEQRK